MASGGREITLEPYRLPGIQHLAVEFDPAVRCLGRFEIAHRPSDDVGDARLAFIAGVRLDMDIVAQGAVRTVEKLDDAEAVIDSFEQGAIAFFGADRILWRFPLLGWRCRFFRVGHVKT